MAALERTTRGSRLPLTFGPWEGVRPQRAILGAPTWLAAAHNMFLRPGGALKQRPGFAQLATFRAGEAQALECVYLDGDWLTFAVVGGHLGRYSWATGLWTDVTPSGFTLSVTGRVALVPFADELVVSDGANLAWAFNPGAGTGRVIPVATVPWYGRPVVRANKLFAILATERRAFGWTEEGTLDDGFEVTVGAVTYDNVWDFRQTSQEPLVALAATNDALYLLRESSASRILGDVEEDFRASTTRDDVSEERGTLSPFGVTVREGALAWIDQYGHPVAYAPGTGVVDLGRRIGDDLAQLEVDLLGAAWGAPVSDLEAFAWALPRLGADLRDLVVLSDEGAYLGTWAHAAQGAATARTFAVGTEVVDGDGFRRFAHLDDDGDYYVLRRDADAAAVADTYAGAGPTIIPGAFVETEAIGAKKPPKAELMVDTVAVYAGALPGAPGGAPTRAKVRVATERRGFPDLALAATVVVPSTGRREVGRLGAGRLARVRVDAAVVDPATEQRLELHLLELTVQVTGYAPTAG